MKNNLFKKILAYSVAGILSVSSLVSFTSFTSFAEEAQEVITKSFTVNKLVATATVGGKTVTLGSSDELTFELSTEGPVYVKELAPTYPGYHLAKADYKKGYSNYVGIDYFFLKQYTDKTSGEIKYSTYFHYTAASGNSDLSQSAAHTKGTQLTLKYELNNYTVTYNAADATNVPTDETVYTIESADSITVSDLVPEKEGFNFVGWTLEETGAVYNPGDSIAFAELTGENIVLTANFEEIASPEPDPEPDPTPDPKPTPDPAPGLEVNAQVVNSWNNQVLINVTVTNTSDETISNWDATLNFDGTIDQLWCADVLSSENGTYTFGHPSWKNDLAAGESFTFGFIATVAP